MPSKERKARQRRKSRTEEEDELSLGSSSLQSEALTGLIESLPLLKKPGRPVKRQSDVLENSESCETPKSSRTKSKSQGHISPIQKRAKIYDLSRVYNAIMSPGHDFQNIVFATEKNLNCQIWRKASLNLYQNDSDNSGFRQIEKNWNDLSEWLNDSFIYSYLCYISSVSTKSVVVVDSLYTDIQQMPKILLSNLKNIVFNSNQQSPPEIILMPLNFPGHWTLLIHDINYGTFLLDSLQISELNFNRVLRVKDIICKLCQINSDDILIQNYPPSRLTLQNDGCSCGFFVCLYAEAWLMNNQSLILPNLDINLEKRRILWHINGLYNHDNVVYHPCSLFVASENENLVSLHHSRDSSMSTDSNINQTPVKRRGRPAKNRSGSGRPKKTENTQILMPVFSDSSLANDLSYSDCSDYVSVSSNCSSNRGGRPKKRSGGPGRRPKKTVHTNLKSNIENINSAQENHTSNIQPVISNELLSLLNSDSIDVPGSQPIAPGRVCIESINKDLIKETWSSPTDMFSDDLVYCFQRYLASKIVDKIVAVVNPQYTNLQSFHVGPIAFPFNVMDNCFNYSTNYDILLMNIFFNGHFALIIFDRSDRDNLICLFIDSLPHYDRLFDPQYPGYDVRRIEIIKNGICELTPGLTHDDVVIRTLSPSEFTPQHDGINCGVFVLLYSEAYLNNCSLKFPNLNINFERRRILWHLAQLINDDNVEYIGRNLENGSQNPQSLPLYNVESNIEQTCPRDGDGAFICVEPDTDRTPDVILRPPSTISSSTATRRSLRLQKSVSTGVSSDDNLINLLKMPHNDITRRCHIKHQGIPCADVRVKHTTEYYDSGNIGDKICEYCNALLLNSEAEKKNGKFSSSFCCNHGSVVLPAYKEHPPILQRFLSGHDLESKEFLSNQNVYNSLLAFASVSVGYRESSLDGAKCYLLNGEFTRKIGLLPGKFAPSFAQLYILDPMAAFLQRTKNIEYGGDRVNEKTIRKLDFMIRKYHPLAKELMSFHAQYQKTLEEQGPESVINFRLTLVEAREAPLNIRDPSLHPRQANLPDEGNSLFAIWAENDQPPILKGIWITTDEGKLQKFVPHHPQTDSLCYPSLFPHGDDGFHPKIPYNLKNRKRNDEAMEVDVASDDNDENSFDSDDNEPADDTESIASSVDSTEKRGPRQFLSIRSYIRYRMALRKNNKLHHIWSSGGGLSQKFILDYASRIDTNKANYLRRPELNLRSTLPDNALRWLSRNAGLNSTEELGSVVMFRRSEPGTRAYFQHKFYDSTTIMSRFKKPGFASFFLTFTTNPRWPEISRNFLHQGQRTVDRFDLICRIYEDKLRHLHYLLDKKNILGRMIGQECREFQKKYGGPHAHRVYHTDLLAIPENVDGLIWAHIPPEPNKNDKSDWAIFIRKVRELLPKYQFHDCGRHCLNHKGKCKKGFPKPFSKFTILHDDRPAIYFRPSTGDGGQTLTVKRGKTQITYDNSRVSAYNPYILVHFETHHNLEYAYGQSTNLKYLYKYPFKGPSFSYVKTNEENGKTSIDEPAYYARMLYRSSPEAYCRIMSLKYAKLSHTVIALSLHLPGQQKIYYKPSEKTSVAQQVQAGILPETPLTAYWKMCETDTDVRKILFERMPEQYSFNKSGKFWKKRIFSKNPSRSKTRERKPIIGRIFPVSPRNPELFALYLLTKHFPGNPQQLKMVNQTHICETFLETARLRGLIDDNDVWVRTMEEGAASLTPAQMRQLLANILIFGATEKCLIDGALLWEKFKSQMYDTRCTEAERPARIDHALALLEKLLVAQNKQCKDYGLPTPAISIMNDPQRGLNEFFFPQHLNDDDGDDPVDTTAFERGKLNAEQQKFFDMVKAAFLNTSNSRLFYLCGDGGTGKTFLLNYILFQLRKIGAKIIPTASTGMASTRFYLGGTTVHSAFKFGINVEPGKLPAIPFDSFFGRRIIESDIMIIDEMTMLERTVFENVDLLCRQLCFQKRHLPFGGKCVIISGDWKQSLPVVINSYGSAAQVAACIQSSPLYPTFSKYKLTQSMRVNPNEVEFLKWLDDVGRGVNGDTVAIPKDMLVDSREELISWVFDQGFNMPSGEMLKRLLLATTNRIVDINNSQISQSMLGNFVEYFSVDKATDENPFAVNAADFDVAQLNQLNPMGMPTHLLRLKIGSIVVLLVNLNTSKGLCNGTRLLIKKLTDNLIECETIGSGSSGNGIIIGIPRNRHTYKDKRPDGVSFERFQFPIRLAFAMTVVKAQGQTAVRLGIDFTEEPFAHGQLYTALSRATSRENIKIYAPNKTHDDNGNPLIRNIIASGLNLD